MVHYYTLSYDKLQCQSDRLNPEMKVENILSEILVTPHLELPYKLWQ